MGGVGWGDARCWLSKMIEGGGRSGLLLDAVMDILGFNSRVNQRWDKYMCGVVGLDTGVKLTGDGRK